jgi:hypothetical protein
MQWIFYVKCLLIYLILSLEFMQDNLHKLVACTSQNVPKIELNYTCTNIHSHTHYNLFQYSNTWS